MQLSELNFILKKNNLKLYYHNGWIIKKENFYKLKFKNSQDLLSFIKLK